MTFTMDIEITIEVEASIIPAQHGGYTDPSWESFAEIESITYDGHSFIPSKELLETIEEEADEKIAEEVAEREIDAAESQAEARRDAEAYRAFGCSYAEL